jgi:hypothetical protein
MLRAFNISPLVLCSAVALLIVGELATGTSVYFVAMMAITVLCIGVTYNILGGLSTFSGWLFTAFALRTIVISQFAKVLLFEAADKNLYSPDLTISVYAVFYLSALVGAYIFGGARLPLPKPLELQSESQAKRLYAISVSVGLAATFAFEFYSQTYSKQIDYNPIRSMGIALSPLLLFSLVIAIDLRIRSTGGRHSISFAALVPWIATMMFGFIDTVRTAILTPTVIYFIVCHLRGYPLKKRHYILAGLGLGFFFYFISPLEIFSRGITTGQPLAERAATALRIFEEHHDPRELRAAADLGAQGKGSTSLEQYFSRPGTQILSRLSLIRPDSLLIHACSNGYHYGMAQIDEEATTIIPSFLYKGKSRAATNNYLANVSGLSPDSPGAQPILSAVSDSYGSFGWAGVVLFPIVFFSAIYVVYESMFDVSLPWGTVAFGSTLLYFSEMSDWRAVPILVRDPIMLLLLSHLIGGIARMIPAKGER